MTIRYLSVVILTMSTWAFPYVVPAIENFEGERGPDEPAVVEHAEKTESPLLKERTNERKESAQILRRLEDADVDEITDQGLRGELITKRLEFADNLENQSQLRRLKAEQAAKQVMLTFLESRLEQAGRAAGRPKKRSLDRLVTQTKQDLKDIALEIAILELTGRAPLEGVDREALEMAYKRVVAIDRKLQRTLRDLEELEEHVSMAQAELDAKKTEVTRLREIREKMVGVLGELQNTVGSNPPASDE